MLFTYAGWIGRTEVVEVKFDPKVISYEKLVRHARDRRCTSPVFTRSDAQQRVAAGIVGKAARRSTADVRGVKDNKYQLGRTPFRYVPLSPIQATRINADTRRGERWLSPRQKAMLARVRAKPDAGWPDLLGMDLRKAWPQPNQKR